MNSIAITPLLLAVHGLVTAPMPDRNRQNILLSKARPEATMRKEQDAKPRKRI